MIEARARIAPVNPVRRQAQRRPDKVVIDGD